MSSEFPTLCKQFVWNDEERECDTCHVAVDDTADDDTMEIVASQLENSAMKMANRLLEAEAKLPIKGAWTMEFQSLFDAQHTCCAKFTPRECIELMPNSSHILKQIDSYDKSQGQMVIWIRVREYSETGDKLTEEDEEADGDTLRDMNDPQVNIEKPVDDGEDDPDMKTRKTVERCFKVSRQGLERWQQVQAEIEGIDEDTPLIVVG